MGTLLGITARASSVGISTSGTNRTALNFSSTGHGTETRRSPLLITTWQPPNRAGATLSGMTLYRIGETEKLLRGDRRSREQVRGHHSPGDCGRAAPETPAQGNLVVASHSQRRRLGAQVIVDGGNASVDHVVGSRAQLSGPVPRDPYRKPVGDARWMMVLKSSRAMPRESKPGPMLAVVAGARTVILSCAPLISARYFNPSLPAWRQDNADE